jgi:hypothetical protein
MMEHKAFAFDFGAFNRELRPILERALRGGATTELRKFILDHRDSLVDPYEGEPLAEDWEDALEYKDAHQYGDFALTRYYDPTQDIGLRSSWRAMENTIGVQSDLPSPLLGRTIGDVTNWFDPGKMGSYFQSSEDVADNLARIRSHLRASDLRDVIAMLEGAPRGLYITF